MPCTQLLSIAIMCSVQDDRDLHFFERMSERYSTLSSTAGQDSSQLQYEDTTDQPVFESIEMVKVKKYGKIGWAEMV